MNESKLVDNARVKLLQGLILTKEEFDALPNGLEVSIITDDNLTFTGDIICKKTNSLGSWVCIQTKAYTKIDGSAVINAATNGRFEKLVYIKRGEVELKIPTTLFIRRVLMLYEKYKDEHPHDISLTIQQHWND